MSHTEMDMKMRILLAAKKLFALYGYDGTSVRQICEEAGANVALISYHFGGKEKVFYSLFENFFPGNRLADNEELLQDPVKGLDLLVRELIRFYMTDTELSSIINQEIAKYSHRTDGIASFTFPIWEKIRELLERGREQGVFQFTSLDQTTLQVAAVTLVPKKLTYFRPILSSTPDFEAKDAEINASLFLLRGLGTPEYLLKEIFG